MRRGKSTATHGPDFQIVNEVAGCIWSHDMLLSLNPPFNTFEKNLFLLYNNDSGSQADCGAHWYIPLEW